MADQSKFKCYIMIFNASEVMGDKLTPVIVPSGSIEDIRIEASPYNQQDLENMVATIDGKEYKVSEGKLVANLPDYGLMSKEDKIKLDTINDNYITQSDVSSTYATKDSPSFTGVPTAPTAAAKNSTTQIATTAYVDRAVANIEIPEISGYVETEEGKGLSSNDYTDQEKQKLAGIAEGAQVNTVTGVKGSSEASYRTGNIEITKANIGLGSVDNTADSAKKVASAGKLTNAIDLKIANSDGTGAGSAVSFDGSASKTLLLPSTIKATLNGTADSANKDGSGNTIASHYAPLASPALTGTPTAPTQAEGDSSTKIATTAYIDRAISAVMGDPPDNFKSLQKISEVIGNLSNIDGTLSNAISNKQEASEALSSISEAADNSGIMVYTVAPGVFAGSGITYAGRTLIGKSSVVDMRTYLGAVDSAATVAAAIKDNANHVISDTYVAKTAAISSIASNGSSTTISYTKADGTTGSFTTKDTVYTLPKATASALGGVIVGSNISLDTSTGKISLTSGNVTAALGYTPSSADTHYTTKLIAGASNSTANAATTNGNLYLRLFDDSTARNSIKVTGAGITTVTSDSTGTITVSTTGYSAATQSAAGLLSAADKKTIDSISTTYVAKTAGITGLSVSGKTITYTKGDGTTGTITTQDTVTTNTDQSVKQTSNATNANYPVIFKASTATTETTTTVYFSDKIKINPSTGTLTATTIAGALAASYLTGTLGIDHGGTGLTSNPSMLTNLGSTTAANVFVASPRPGVTGTLGVANGGTGQTSVANIQAGKDDKGNVISTTYATKATAMTAVGILNGILSKTINGSTTYVPVTIPYGTATQTAIAKTVAITNFTLATGSRITVKFTNNGVAGNCTLNVNGTGAKAIYYRGYQLPGDALLANTTLDLVYNGSQWEVVGSFFWTT